MEMFLMVLCLSLFGVAALSIAFAAATRPEQQNSTKAEQQRTAEQSVPAGFFVNSNAPPIRVASQVPIEALLLQIENHVRLEHAAAESFLDAPTPDLLHCKTISPLVQ